jgi:nitrogen-specific signal transduction histidine kinase/DNA-binding NarL/FixJ family response regulator
MQGVIIASAEVALRKSLAAILQDGRTIHECGSVSECLALAAAHKMDYVFIDDSLGDGCAEDLARRLRSLGYGIEIIPILVSTDRLYLQPFLPHGVRHGLAKPFDVRQIEALIEQIEQVVSLRPPVSGLPGDAGLSLETERGAHAGAGDSLPVQEVDVREISQRFRRLLAQSLGQTELIHTFVESMQEQFDVDNVVVLLPARGEPAFRAFAGNIVDEVKEQFFIPFDEPLVACLIRLGEPVWVHDHERLGRANTVASLRYAERLGVQVLCPVLSRGRALALVGISRIHRFASSPILLSLLRLFLSFFSKALENAELFERASQARETYRRMVDALPLGFVAVSATGCITHLNPAAALLLRNPADELLDQPIERAGSLLADVARQVLHSGAPASSRLLPLAPAPLSVSAVPMGADGHQGALLILERGATPPAAAVPDSKEAAGQEQLWRDMAAAMAHNFKNAMVPVKTCAELLPERYQSESFRGDFFNTVTSSLQRMDLWIGKLLRFSELDRALDHRESVPLHEAMEAGAARALSRMQADSVDISRAYADGDVTMANRLHLEQVCFELVENALEAVQGHTDPRLSLRTERAGDTVRATVQDNGPGVDPALLAGDFRPFTSRKGSGLGLGLAYSQRVVRLHGGQLDILPATGGGACVRLSLPLAPQGPVSVSQASGGEPGAVAQWLVTHTAQTPN